MTCAFSAGAAEHQDPLAPGPHRSIALVESTATAELPHELSYASGVLRLLSEAPILDIASASAAAAATADTPKPEGRIRRLLNKALTLLGTPYRWGGTSPEAGFDCSGLVAYVYRSELDLELPRISRDMAKIGELVSDRDQLQEGDLVFFSRRGRSVDHVGLYIGEGRFVHAPRRGKHVEISKLDSGYWANRFMKGRRLEQDQG